MRTEPRPAVLFLAFALSVLAGCASTVNGAGDAAPDTGTDAGTDARMDAGPGDAGPGACMLPRGGLCPRGQTCPAGDGCNSCICSATGESSCTELVCPDAGTAVGCTSSSQCPAGRTCVAQPDCAPSLCVETPCTFDLAPFCGCDGATFRTSSTCPDRPYRFVGACPMPVDAGGRGCDTTADCPPDSVCEGPGCEPGQGVCAPLSRPCTEDLAAYCGCDGVTFNSSGSCPGRRFRHRGACP